MPKTCKTNLTVEIVALFCFAAVDIQVVIIDAMILKTRLQERIINKEVLRCTGLTTSHTLCWLGHVLRMSISQKICLTVSW